MNVEELNSQLLKTVKVGDENVVIDLNKLKFNDATIKSYLEEEALWYSYFTQKLADAENLMQIADIEYDAKYYEKFKIHKESGCTEKMAEASAKSDLECFMAKKKFAELKHVVKTLQQFINAFDKSHQNAQTRAYMLRKELEKINLVSSENEVEGFKKSSVTDINDLLKDM